VIASDALSSQSDHHFCEASSQELWQLSGGVFNVDDVLQTMVLGLEEDLEERRLDLEERRLEAGV